jgi:hypothetical protein
MKVKQFKYKSIPAPNGEGIDNSNLVLVFGERNLIESPGIFDSFHKSFPNANIAFCSTAGEILNNEVYDDSLAVTAIHFEKTEVKSTIINIKDYADSFTAGKHLVDVLNGPSLKHILVLADGQLVNGSELVRGINSVLPDKITVSGGLAGDGTRFQKTLVGLNDNIKEGNIVALGLYGNNLLVGHGSNGGWDSFGPYRRITKSKSNVLFELEDKSALELYKQYLGELATGLPGSALLFPLSIKLEEDSEPVVRTILSVSEAEQSMTFAGDMPEGAQARLMKANFDRLIDAASDAASNSFTPFKDHKPQLALLISCVGRKIVLDQRVEEEVESVRNVLGPETAMTGFYSYGEISPLLTSVKCGLHNQTMTITTFSEV